MTTEPKREEEVLIAIISEYFVVLGAKIMTGDPKEKVSPARGLANKLIKAGYSSHTLLPLDIMAMRECGQEAVKKELHQTHNWKLIRIVCEAIYERFGLPGRVTQSDISDLDKFTECEHKAADELDPLCPACNMAWCIGRIKYLEAKLAKEQT